MLKSINIKRFRNFKEVILKIPTRLTLISGANGIGKSTLLGIIANGSGTKSFKTLNTKEFHPDFNKYFILSKDEHKSAKSSKEYYEAILEYYYQDYTVYKRVRTSHPNADKPKLVPRTTDKDGKQKDSISQQVKDHTNITESGRVPLPTYYLSISRLFPFGESGITSENFTKVTSRRSIGDLDNTIKDYIEMYNRVLPRSIEIDSTEMFEITKPKIGSSLYINPGKFDLLTQSIGQDSLSSIINALLSFKNISKEEGYIGGMLCIDEIDASLHPDAQKKLLKLLKEQAEELNLQIVFTSHSLTMIKEMLFLQKKNPNEHSVLYFRNKTNPYIKTDDDYKSIKADLFSEINYYEPKVKVYLEDAEAKFSLEQILKIYEGKKKVSLLNHCEIIASQINCDTLLKLPNKDPYFQDVIIILDGDAKFKNKPKITQYLEKDPTGYNQIKDIPKNILFLPSDFSPEESLIRGLYYLAKNEQSHDDFWISVRNNAYGLGNYYPDIIINEIEEMNNNNHFNREYLKTWFKKHKSFFDQSSFFEYYYDKVSRDNQINILGERFQKLFDITLKRLKSKGF